MEKVDLVARSPGKKCTRSVIIFHVLVLAKILVWFERACRIGIWIDSASNIFRLQVASTFGAVPFIGTGLRHMFSTTANWGFRMNFCEAVCKAFDCVAIAVSRDPMFDSILFHSPHLIFLLKSLRPCNVFL
nr:MAG TPA: hypothetical protein [Caudoviricetes sp.]